MALLRHRFELPLFHALRQWFVLTFRGTRLSGFSTLAPNSQLLAQPVVSGSPTNHPSLVPPWLRANSTGALLLAFCALSLSRTPRTYLRLQYALVMWRLTTDALLLSSRQEAMSKIAPAAATAIHRSEGQLARAHGHVLGWLLRAGAGSLATKALLRSWRKWSFYVDTAIDKEVTGSSTTTGTPIPASAVAAAHHPAKQKRGTRIANLRGSKAAATTTRVTTYIHFARDGTDSTQHSANESQRCRQYFEVCPGSLYRNSARQQRRTSLRLFLCWRRRRSWRDDGND